MTDVPASESSGSAIDAWLKREAALDAEFDALVARLELTTLREKQIAGEGFKAGRRFAENEKSGNAEESKPRG